jgi:hypothetical protein
MDELQASQGGAAEFRKPLAVFAYVTDLVQKQIATALNSEHGGFAGVVSQCTTVGEAGAGK